MRAAILAVAAVLAVPAIAQPLPTVSYGMPAGGLRDIQTGPLRSDDGDVGPFFYPGGYDPQYGSEGRVADAEDFAAGYGCRPIWNAKTGRLIPACN